MGNTGAAQSLDGAEQHKLDGSISTPFTAAQAQPYLNRGVMPYRVYQVFLIANVLDMQAGLAASPRSAWAPLMLALSSITPCPVTLLPLHCPPVVVMTCPQRSGSRADEPNLVASAIRPY